MASLTGLSPSPAGLPRPFRCLPSHFDGMPLPRHARVAVWALPISLAATLGIDFSFFSSGYLDVSVHRVPSVSLSGLPLLQHTVTEVFSAGFPHSDICGSLLICSSPQLFAAYHVFLRPFVPRHPPCALLCLTFCLLAVLPLTLSVASFGFLVLSLSFTCFSTDTFWCFFYFWFFGSRCCLSRFST